MQAPNVMFFSEGGRLSTGRLKLPEIQRSVRESGRLSIGWLKTPLRERERREEGRLSTGKL